MDRADMDRGDKVSGVLGDLSKKELKKLRAATPIRQHWLAGHSNPGDDSSKANKSDVHGFGICVGITLLFFLMFLQLVSPEQAFKNAFGCFPLVVFVIWPRILKTLPASSNYIVMRRLLKSAVKGYPAALSTPIEATIDAAGETVVNVPSLHTTWRLRGDKRSKNRATRALGSLNGHRGHFAAPPMGSLALPHVSPSQNMANTVNEPAVAPPVVQENVCVEQTWGDKLLSGQAEVELRAGERAGGVVELIRSLAEIVDVTSPVDDTAAEALATIKEDAEAAVDVYIRLDPKATGLTLASGKTPTDELVALLDVLKIEATSLFEQSQTGTADELSYLRRLNENRYQPSNLDRP